MKKKQKFLLITILISWLLYGWPPVWLNPRVPPRIKEVEAVTETRYMRGDQQTVNTLTAYQLGTSQSSTSQSNLVSTSNSNGQQNGTVNWGIRVWYRNSSGTETEVTSGTPVAQVTRTANGEGIQSATWSCPQTTGIAATDSIVIRVYTQIADKGVSWTENATFTTEQMNAGTLDAVTWTVYYYTMYYTFTSTPSSNRRTEGTFYWGTSTYNSRVTNLSYTEPPTVSISLTTDGAVAFGMMAADSTQDTTASGVNDVETVSVDTGPADLDIKASTFSDGSNTWTLSTTNGANQVHFEYSKDGSNWNNFTTAESYYAFDTNITQGDTRSVYLRLTTPTSTNSYNQHSTTVTILATAP